MTTVITIIVVIGALIFFHELGHLILAKRSGILCREFALGFGPKIVSFKRGETLYTIRIIPLGGYVRMAGEDPELIEIKTGYDVGLLFNEEKKVNKMIVQKEATDAQARYINVQRVDLNESLFIEGYDENEQLIRFDVDPQAMIRYDRHEVQIAPADRQFGNKSVLKRAATLFAGPMANFLLAFVILLGIGLWHGVPSDEPLIDDVQSNSAADQAGLEVNDRVVSINDERIHTWDDMVQIIVFHPHEELQFVIERNGELVQSTVIPEAREHPMLEGEMQGFIGVQRPIEHGIMRSLQYGVNQTVQFSLLIFQGIGMLITGGAGIDDLAGPVGIFDYTGQFAQEGMMSLLYWTAILSVNLAIFNLLPIPALDGGRLLFVGLEAIRGRPIDPHKEGVVHFVGFALLMLLVLVVTWNDIQRLFN